MTESIESTTPDGAERITDTTDAKAIPSEIETKATDANQARQERFKALRARAVRL